MIELDNASNYAAGLFPAWSQQGDAQYTVVVKKVYEYDSSGKLSIMQPTPELVVADQYYGEPGFSSVIHPSEIVPFKFGSEVIVTGKVFPPVAQPPVVMETTLGLQFPNGRRWSKSLLVIGERQWRSSLLGTVASDPSYLKPIDLIYEYAFGGQSAENPEKVLKANPVGIGFDVSGRKARGQNLPQIETPGNLLHKPGKEVPVAGYGPIALHWSPRMDEVPKIDEEALVSGNYPYCSAQSERWHNQAPSDQQLPRFEANEVTLELKGLTAGLDYRQTLQIKLPLVAPQVELRPQKADKLAVVCDTLLINTEQQTITQLWRGAIIKSKVNQRSWVTIIDDSSSCRNTQSENADAID